MPFLFLVRHNDTQAEQYPDVPFEWVELKNGGLGVFAIQRKDLVKYHDLF